jgi:phospholipid/cholesterol/gamma-HCH transport system substrate-binding protein
VKKQQRIELAVGFLFLAATLLLGVYTIVVSRVSFTATKKYIIDFDIVYGLKEGDPVRVEGFEKGEVKSLRLIEREKKDGARNTGVRAVIEVSKDVVIYKNNSLVKVTPFSPLGGRVIEIERGQNDAGQEDARGEYTFFANKEGVSEDEADIIEGYAEGELLGSLNELVESNRADVRLIVENLRKVTDQLTRTDNVIGYLVNSDEGGRSIEATVAHLGSASARVDRILAKVEDGDGVVGGLLQEGSPLEREVDGLASAGRRTFESASSILERADQGRSPLGVFVGEDPAVTGEVRGIVGDVKVVTDRIAKGQGTIGKLVHDDRLYEGAASTAENLAVITSKVNAGEGILGVLSDEGAGQDVRATLAHLSSITGAVDDPEAGTLGMLVHDQPLRRRIARVAEEVERLVVDFRDSLEDVREQAPVNAFIGAVFAAF